MPVISCRWNAIPEIVDNYKTGILIPIKSSSSLLSAIKYFNNENFSSFSINAHEKFNEFDSNKVNKNILKTIMSIWS